MNRRSFLRGVASIPAAVAAVSLGVVAAHEDIQPLEKVVPLDARALALALESYRAGIISLDSARYAFGLSGVDVYPVTFGDATL